MITQKVKTIIESMVADCSDGDVGIGAAFCKDNNKVAITFSNLKKKQKIGSSVTDDNVDQTPFIVTFDKLESIDSLKKAVDKCIDMLKIIEEKNNDHTFIVNYKDVFVTSAFRGSNPHPEKMLECFSNYSKTKEFDRDIVVSKNLVLQDGYVAYLVAGFSGLQKLTVTANEGIDIQIGGELINFKSSEIELSYGLVENEDNDENSHFALIIKSGNNCYKIDAAEVKDAVRYLMCIKKVFRPKFFFTKSSTFNIGLINAMKLRGIPCEVRF